MTKYLLLIPLISLTLLLTGCSSDKSNCGMGQNGYECDDILSEKIDPEYVGDIEKDYKQVESIDIINNPEKNYVDVKINWKINYD